MKRRRSASRTCPERGLRSALDSCGIQPSDVELTSDTWGAKDATFTLTRELFVPWPDIQAFAPVEIAVGGVVVWRGRIVDAPTNSLALHRRPLRGQAEPPRRRPVRARVRPYRHHPVAGRARLTGRRPHAVAGRRSGHVGRRRDLAELARRDSVGRHGVRGRHPRPRPVCGRRGEGGTHVPTPRGNPSMVVLAMRSAESVDQLRGTGRTPTASRPWRSAPPLPRRRPSRPPQPDRPLRLRAAALRHDVHPTLEDGIAIDAIQVFTDTAYVSGGVSVLRGDQVVKDALNTATVQLSDDQSLIDSTGSSFYIPEFAPQRPQDPRQAIEGVNVFYDWRTKVDEQDRFVFEDRAGEARRCVWDAGVLQLRGRLLGVRRRGFQQGHRHRPGRERPPDPRDRDVRRPVERGLRGHHWRASLEPRIRERHVRVGGQRVHDHAGHDSAHRHLRRPLGQ